ncbi:MAG TPA: hypothetical protein VFJ16_14045 [Longimicrobium sp.]|nr:hypothetical protein [Longimicrobium sp.]
MTTPRYTRRNPTPEPLRTGLVEVRRGLLRLHKALIDSERGEWERSRGPVTNSQLLQALIEDPFFAWLRPFSGLIVQIDEALSGEEAVTDEAGRDFVRQARELVAVDEGDEPTVNRYDLVCRRDPNVLLLHVELNSRLNDALADGSATA